MKGRQGLGIDGKEDQLGNSEYRWQKWTTEIDNKILKTAQILTYLFLQLQRDQFGKRWRWKVGFKKGELRVPAGKNKQRHRYFLSSTFSILFLKITFLALYGEEMFFGFFGGKKRRVSPLPLCYKSIKNCLCRSPFSIDFEKFNLLSLHIFANFRI